MESDLIKKKLLIGLNKHLKKVLIILLITIFLLTSISYIEKSKTTFSLTVLLTPFVPIFLLNLGAQYDNKICKIIMGSFHLKDSEELNSHIYRNYSESENPQKMYILIASVVFVLLYAAINFFKINISSLIIPGLSLVSIGAALGILTFNYAKNIETVGNINTIIFSSAKRFYLSTLFAIFSLFLILILAEFFHPIQGTAFLSPSSFLIASLESFIGNFSLLFFYYLFATALRYLYEAIFLVLKETIIVE